MQVLKCLIVLFALLFGSAFGDEKWRQFFSTNLDEFQDHPLMFDNPLPQWLKGTLIRNGLGRFEMGNEKLNNAVDSFAKLSSWKFKGDGSAYFTTKLIRSISYNESLGSNTIAPYMTMGGVDPPWNIETTLKALLNGPDNMNVNVKNFGKHNLNDFAIMSDYWNMYTIDPYTLSTLAVVKPNLPDGSAYRGSDTLLSSGHPLPEYGADNYITFVTYSNNLPFSKFRVALERILSSTDRETIAQITLDKGSYMHSFALTQHYAVLIAMPFFFDPKNINVKNMKPLDAFKWDKHANTTLHVINLSTGNVKEILTENIFYLHVVNAYESDLFGDEIMIDLCTYHDDRGLRSLDFAILENDTLRAESPSTVVKRITVDLHQGSARVDTHTSKSGIDISNKFDYPTINENYRSKTYCFAYGTVNNVDGKDFLHAAVVKKDFCRGINEHFWSPPGSFLTEAYFVPTPGALEEDDGIVMLPVHDSFTNTTQFTILDAKDLTVISKATLPTNMPFGTHGHFFDYIF